jgi:hypothetical protein
MTETRKFPQAKPREPEEKLTTQYAFVEPWPSLGINALAATTSTTSFRTVMVNQDQKQ